MNTLGWIKQGPRSTVLIGDADALFETDAARSLSQEYQTLILASEERIPLKKDFDPIRLGVATNHLFIFAVTKPDICIVRLAAEGARNHTGPYVKGNNYYDNVPEDRRKIAIKAMHMAIDTPCAFRVEAKHRYDDGRTRIFESLLVPLASEESGVDGFLIGSSQPIGEDSEKILPTGKSSGNVILCRDLIDIGFGVDDSFYDLVPT